MEAEKVDTMLMRFEHDQRCLLLFTDGDLIDSLGKPVEGTLWEKCNFKKFGRLQWRWLPGRAVTDLLRNNNKVTGATVALRRSLLEHSLPIEVPYGYWHDAWFALHAAALDLLTFISDRLINYRIHARQQNGVTGGVAPLNHDCVSMATFTESLKRQYPARTALIVRARI